MLSAQAAVHACLGNAEAPRANTRGPHQRQRNRM
jgi:hypothetical protein